MKWRTLHGELYLAIPDGAPVPILSEGLAKQTCQHSRPGTGERSGRVEVSGVAELQSWMYDGIRHGSQSTLDRNSAWQAVRAAKAIFFRFDPTLVGCVYFLI